VTRVRAEGFDKFVKLLGDIEGVRAEIVAEAVSRAGFMVLLGVDLPVAADVGNS